MNKTVRCCYCHQDVDPKECVYYQINDGDIYHGVEAMCDYCESMLYEPDEDEGREIYG